MKEYSVGMALFDLIPVILFAIASVKLWRDLYFKMNKGVFALFAAGTTNIVVAGALKALYKLLYAAGICDFQKLNDMFLPTQSIGFILAGLAIIAVFLQKKSTKTTALAVGAPVVYTGTGIFIIMMVLGLTCIDAALCIFSVKLRKKWLIAVFVLSYICLLAMGRLASMDFDKAIYNWIAEGTNTLGQGLLLFGVSVLHKNGLEKVEL
ncbi:MAG: hypothetical protein K6B75_09315 [Lachnospiraceae bacterium]|nr:hypothetical protein [Lachnospiraceae bacterium]